VGEEKLLPRNRTARLAQAAQIQAAGNPVVTELESGVGNCFPGLELDLRNVDRRFFPFVTVDFVGGQVVVADVDLDGANQELSAGQLRDGLRRLATEAPGTWQVTRINGDFAGLGRRTLAVRDLGDDDQLPPDAWTAVRLIRPSTQVEVTLQRPGGGASLTLSAPRASYLTDDAAFAAMFRPGELTQSLCSPWTHDFRDCGCFYWASNHPDIVLPALPTGVAADDPDWGERVVWLRSARQDRPPPAPDVQHTGELRHIEINSRWQDLDVVLDGREQRVPYAPGAAPAATPLPPGRLVPALRYAAGVELAVMLEYLTAVFSLNRNAGTPGSALRGDARAARAELLRVAVGEMRHLREVNDLLFDLHRESAPGTPFAPALGVATAVPEPAGAPPRPVRFRALTPDVLAEFVEVEAPSLTVDGLYISILATLERDDREREAAVVQSIMADGADHFATFRAIQEWLGRHAGTPYLLALRTAPASDPGLATRQQRYEGVLRQLHRAYAAGVVAGAADVAAARQAMLGPNGVEGACEALAQRGFLSTFAVPNDPRFAPVAPPA
jgi:hypothetical protein